MAAINPLALFRERLGYQAAIPSGFPTALGGWWLPMRVGLVLATLLACVGLARRRGEGLQALVLWATALVAMVFAAAMPHHRYEYYLYFSLAPLAIALSYGGLLLPRSLSRAWLVGGGAGLVAMAAVHGYLLPRTNGFVRQATHAQVGVDFARQLPDQAHLHFFRSEQAAWDDLVNGVAMAAMLPGKPLTLTFGHKDPRPFPTSSTPDRVLAYLEPRSWEPGRIHVLDTAVEEIDTPINLLGSAGTLRQTLATTGQEIVGVGLSFGTYGQSRPCRLQIEVYASRRDGARQRLAAETVPCARLVDNAFHVVKVTPYRGDTDERVEVEISSDARDDGEAVALWATKKATDPHLQFVGEGDASARQRFEGASLAYVVARSWLY